MAMKENYLSYIENKSLFAATSWARKLIAEEGKDPSSAVELAAGYYKVNAAEVKGYVDYAAAQEQGHVAMARMVRRTALEKARKAVNAGDCLPAGVRDALNRMKF